MAEVTASSTDGVIVAKPSRDYRWRRYALVVVIFGYGLYSLYDGFNRYPRENAQASAKGLEILPHPGFDVQFNKGFGVGLPPLSLIFLAWVLYASRGSYQFDGTNLTVPGHGTFSVKSIRRIDRSKWDRKGIAYLHYQVPGSAKLGVVKLDDFIYERVPTDEIFKQVEAAIEGPKMSALNMPQQRILCTHCNAQNASTALMCSNCGAPLDVKNMISQA